MLYFVSLFSSLWLSIVVVVQKNFTCAYLCLCCPPSQWDQILSEVVCLLVLGLGLNAPLSFLCLTVGLCLQLYWSENVRWPNYQWDWTISEREFFNFSLIWEIHLQLQKVHSHIIFFNRYTKNLGLKSTLLRFQKNVNIQVSKKRKYFKALGSKWKYIQPG